MGDVAIAIIGKAIIWTIAGLMILAGKKWF